VKTPPPISDLEHLPAVLTLREMSGLYRISPSTIRRGLQNGTFRPRPWDRYPYRWKRSDVLADLEQRRTEHTMRHHGFASARGRAVKAELTANRAPRRDPAAS
jgi:hypothetical protein